MAKGFKHGASSSTSLNFKVVGGTTEPASPKENTIWVNTDTPITDWYFSATQPENMEEGDVWFPVGTSSPVAFDALKKQNIMVYPQLAQQYVGGTLVNKVAKTYQGGEWVDLWDGTALFSNGNQWEAVTGGWVNAPQINASYANIIPIKVGDSIELDVNSTSGYRQCVAITKNKIDTTGYTAVEVNVSSFANSSGHIFNLYILKACSANSWSIVAEKEITSRGKSLISITTSGKYYIAIGFITTEGAGGLAKITEVRLAK